jgi:hypothetical protein
MTPTPSSTTAEQPEVLVVAKLWAPMMEALRGAFRVHDRIHETDPTAFAAVAPRIRAISGSGESKVSREQIAQLPKLEVISVFGVGYDGVDVAAARERGISVSNTPDVLTDCVADTAVGLMIDTLRRRYVAYLRRLPHRAMSVSTDFMRWTPPAVCLEARDGEMSNSIYNHIGFVYGDRYLGFLTYFVRDPKNPLLTVRLLTSRDGERWQRPETAQPLIGSGSIGDVDRFTNMITGAPPIRVGNRLHIYYRALANRHRPYEGTDSSLKGGGISLATLRVDGFASLDGGYDGGQVTTRPFLFEGAALKLNAKANVGQIAVELLDDQRKPIPGFTREQCAPMEADSLEHMVGWKGASLAALQGKPVRLRFHLHNARLYSYRITA